MKLRDLFAVAAVSLLAACETPYRATDTTVVVAPESVQTAFIEQYPYATNVVWTYHDPAIAIPMDWELAGWTIVDENDYLVRFDMDNEYYYAWYDDTGEWIGTAYVMRDFTTTPSVVLSAARNRYPGYTVTSVSREFQKDNRLAYEIEMKNSDTRAKLLVDANGNILKEKTRPLY
jgi:hypothetical protein